jgi:hypothetical protein
MPHDHQQQKRVKRDSDGKTQKIDERGGIKHSCFNLMAKSV